MDMKNAVTYDFTWYWSKKHVNNMSPLSDSTSPMLS